MDPIMKPLMVLHSKGRLLAFPTNIRLEQKWRAVTNALAYNNSVLITAVKSFIK
jgi:hypothetical protein